MPIMAASGLILTRETGGVLATDCDSGCSGQDPRCSHCHCSAALAAQYTVSISGLPAICGCDGFNGTWSLSWIADCLWRIDTPDSRRIQLSLTTPVAVSWSYLGGGPSGSFLATSGNACDPSSLVWEPQVCYEPSACTGVCAGFTANGVCVLT